MQDLAGRSLNCTANDVQLSTVTNVTISDPCDFPGDSVTFTADFETVLTAQERHDIGIYFAVDADPNGDGALTGTCAVSTLNYTPDPPWLDLDGTDDQFVDTNIVSGIQDTCGDIDAEHNPLFPRITVTAVCVDNDQDGFLDLPYCTSWRQPGANELCTGPLAEEVEPGLFSSGVVPGSPSKCNCEPGFDVPVPVPPADLEVSKTANPTSFNEPSASVTFTVRVTNIGIDPNNDVTLTSLLDDIYGDITTTGHDGITATTCIVPQTLQADDGNPGGIDTYQCTFTATVSGDAGDSETDTVTATGIDDRGNTVEGEDDATVTIVDVQPNITVTKTADPTAVFEPGGMVTFTVDIFNNSVSSDPVTITSLTDDIHGDLNGQGTCSVPQVLAGAGGSYSCSFTAAVTGNAGYVETDTVTASGTDDEGNPVSDSDSATVTVRNVPSMIELIKTADPTEVNEPGDLVTYTFTINNLSGVDTVTITSLVDSILGDLNGLGDCAVPQILPPGGSYTCMVIATVTGDAFDTVTNTATAMGVDDDGEPVMAADDASVDINNVPPAADLTKTATEVLVTYEVEVCNLSDAESLTVDALDDDVYGDITDPANLDITETSCAVPQTLAPSGEPGECYTCTFKAITDTSPTTDTVTGTVNDDDGSTPSTPSDSATVSFE